MTGGRQQWGGIAVPRRCAVAQSKVRARGMSDLTRTVRDNEFAGGIT